MWLVRIALALAVLYALVVVLAYAVQTWLIFPSGLAGGAAAALPDHAERLRIETPEGIRLEGVRLAPPGAGPRTLLLGFGGNAWNAEAMAVTLADLFPGSEVVVFHYRGYTPSTGRPSATALLNDSLLVHDEIATRAQGHPIVAVGFSIGAGVAAHVAAHRPIAGAILVTPFDSLVRLASAHYPWLPVRLLLRHRMETAKALAGADVPVAIIVAERDTIVPAARSMPVRSAARELVFDRTISDVGHNDIYQRAEFADAMSAALTAIEASYRGK